MGASRHFAAIALSMSLCGGCVSSAHHRWQAEPVKPGTPAADPGGRQAAAGEARTPDPQKPVEFGVSRPARSGGLSVEAFDKQLAAALVYETAQPTAANHLRVAVEYRRIGIFDLSARHLDQAIARAPRFADAHEMLAQIWRDWGYPDQGLGPAYRAVTYAPHSASAENTLGTILAALGRTDDARRAYERALRLDPKADWVFNNLCALERRTGRFDVAMNRCQTAIDLNPGLKAAHNNLALTFAALGDLSRARAEFIATGDEATASYNMGIVLLADGDYKSAAEAFETAIRLRPEFTAAKKRAHAVRMYLLTSGL